MNESLPLIQSKVSVPPAGGSLLLYGMQAAYTMPSTAWTIVQQVDADPQVTPRYSRAIFQSTGDSSQALLVKIDEYDSATEGKAGLAASLTKNQLASLASSTTVGDICFTGPSQFAPLIYFLRGNIVVTVTNFGKTVADVQTAASGIDAMLTAVPAKYSRGTISIEAQSSTESGVFLVKYSPASPKPSQYFTFFANTAIPFRKNLSLYVLLPGSVINTTLQAFLFDTSTGKASGTGLVELPPGLRAG
jgi:hypothetical protein